MSEQQQYGGYDNQQQYYDENQQYTDQQQNEYDQQQQYTDQQYYANDQQQYDQTQYDQQQYDQQQYDQQQYDQQQYNAQGYDNQPQQPIAQQIPQTQPTQQYMPTPQQQQQTQYNTNNPQNGQFNQQNTQQQQTTEPQQQLTRQATTNTTRGRRAPQYSSNVGTTNQQTQRPIQNQSNQNTNSSNNNQNVVSPRRSKGLIRPDRMREETRTKTPPPTTKIDETNIPRVSINNVVINYDATPGTERLPPSARDPYIAKDNGNATPRHVRMTTYNIPALAETADRCNLAVAATCQPFANIGLQEEPIEVVDMGPNGPIRCENCRGYMNCHVKWSSGGRDWICNLCGLKNEVPMWYRSNLDQHHKRRDRMERPELNRGSVDFVAPEQLGKDMQSNPAFFFIIDVSPIAYQRGLVECEVNSVRDAVYELRERIKSEEQGIQPELDEKKENEDNINENIESRNENYETKCILQVGFLTYDSKIHFHGLTNGQLYTITQINDPFVAIPHSEILFNIMDDNKYLLFDDLLVRIPKLFEYNKNITGIITPPQHEQKESLSSQSTSSSNDSVPVPNKSCLGAAMATAVKVLYDCGGKIFVVQSSLPRCGIGKLKDRDNVDIYGTPAERELYGPQTMYWERLTNECSFRFISCDLFVASSGYCDIASTGNPSIKTGGEIYYYSNFQADKDGDNFYKDFKSAVLKHTVFRCIMVIRCTQGIETCDYMGPFFMTEDSEIQFAAMTSDTTFCTRMQHYEELPLKSNVSIQFAMCYLNIFGDVNIRVHNLACPVVRTINDVFRCVDVDGVLSVSLKQCAQEMVQPVSTTMTIEQARKSLTLACIEILHTYRRFCATNNIQRQLVLPEALKLLPLYTLGLLKNPILADGISADERSYFLAYALMMPVYQSLTFVHPYLYPIHNLAPNECVIAPDTGRVLLPRTVNVRKEELKPNGLYALDNGRKIYIVIGAQLNKKAFQQAFVVNNEDKNNDIKLKEDYEIDVNDLGYRLSLLLDELRYDKPMYLDHFIMILPDKNQILTIDQIQFLDLLIEDASRIKVSRTRNTRKNKKKEPHKMSYIDFLVYIHKEIQKKYTLDDL